jgi:hypothetical protein
VPDATMTWSRAGRLLPEKLTHVASNRFSTI